MVAMTEADAKTKLCPQLSAEWWADDDIAYDDGACRGWRCMAWRWAGWANVKADGSLEIDEVKGGPLLMPHGPTQNSHGCVRLGYCGLAGEVA